MAKILYLVHRMPYPPNKGDKVRSYHLLRHLAERHQVYLGTFIDDPDDEVHIDTLRGWCADLHVARLQPTAARLASLRGLVNGQALTLPYYRNAGLAEWVKKTQAAESIDATVVFSACMAQYTSPQQGARVIVDFVDVDSAKWAEYAHQHRWPMSWLYRREGRQLLAYERAVATRVAHGFFATEKETQLFLGLAPECAGQVSAMNNGVDANYFSPLADRPSPFQPNETAIVFTGAMDYWPNIDAVTWFAREALPALRQSFPGLRFHIVGRSPAPAVQALATDGVVVTGTVPDVRPYLQHAAVVVAPLRLARGIQNKVLEAMAMARPVVAAQACVQALHALPGQEIVSAQDSPDFVREVTALLHDPQRASATGRAGRQRVLQSYDWSAHLSLLARQLDSLLRQVAPPAVAAMPRHTAESMT